MKDLTQIKFWLFDLDNTLYSPSCRLFDQVDRNITNYISKYIELEWDEAYRLQMAEQGARQWPRVEAILSD